MECSYIVGRTAVCIRGRLCSASRAAPKAPGRGRLPAPSGKFLCRTWNHFDARACVTHADGRMDRHPRDHGHSLCELALGTKSIALGNLKIQTGLLIPKISQLLLIFETLQ